MSYIHIMRLPPKFNFPSEVSLPPTPSAVGVGVDSYIVSFPLTNQNEISPVYPYVLGLDFIYGISSIYYLQLHICSMKMKSSNKAVKYLNYENTSFFIRILLIKKTDRMKKKCVFFLSNSLFYRSCWTLSIL